jgi:acyl-CoA synthetase (AMP-forming)/AMP-acid ligase II
VRPTDTSDVLFTSGTTGRPKGVVMTHGQTIRQFREWCEFAGLQAGDRYLIVNPFFHMFGYKAGWLASLLQGATIVPVQVFDVATVLSLVETERITVLPGAPTIYRSILDHRALEQFDLHTLRVAITGAADIPVALIEEMRANLPFRSILTGYGLTEAGTCTGTRPDDDAETIATTAGQAMPGLEVIVADADGHELQRGATGELLVRGYSVMQGYLDDPEATAAAIDDRGFLRTGQVLENTGVTAYDGAVALLRTPQLQTAGATIATVEARHASFLNFVNGDNPFPSATDTPKSPGEIIAAIQPFVRTAPSASR